MVTAALLEDGEVSERSDDIPKFVQMRRRAHDMVEGAIDTWFEYSLLGVIFVNVLALIVSTLPVTDHDWLLFEIVEWASIVIFTIEYVMRLWACIEDPEHAKRGPFWGRVSYALTFYPIVDLLSIAPNWVSFASFAIDPLVPSSTFFESPNFTTAARIVRLVRIFKTDKYLNAFSLLGGVLYDNRVLLLATTFYSAMCWIIASTLLYFTELDNPDPDMAKYFQSIPSAMFPTLLMLTGEYPLSDFTPLGQLVAGFVAIVAVAIFAVPTSVLGSGFIQAVQQSTNRTFTVDT